MFGLGKKKTEQPDAQIPYEVYETVQQPAAERRRWIIRLIAALLVVTLLIFGFLALSRSLLNRGAGDAKTGTGQQGQSQAKDDGPTNNDLKPPKNLQQDPKQNTTLPAGNSKPDVVVPDSETIKSTVRKPE